MSRLGRLAGEVLVPLVAVVTLPLGILVALYVGLFEAAVVFVVGWLLLVPTIAILAGFLGTGHGDVKMPEGAASTDAAHEADDDPIEVLRDRYARGDIDEAELERRLDALLELDGLDPDDEATIERVRDRLGAEEGDVELERE